MSTTTTMATAEGDVLRPGDAARTRATADWRLALVRDRVRHGDRVTPNEPMLVLAVVPATGVLGWTDALVLTASGALGWTVVDLRRVATGAQR